MPHRVKCVNDHWPGIVWVHLLKEGSIHHDTTIDTYLNKFPVALIKGRPIVVAVMST